MWDPLVVATNKPKRDDLSGTVTRQERCDATIGSAMSAQAIPVGTADLRRRGVRAGFELSLHGARRAYGREELHFDLKDGM